MISESHSRAARQNAEKAAEANRRPKVTKSCEACGAEMVLPASWAKRRFCSRPCRYGAMRGPNGPNFGGGEKIRGDKHPLWKGGHGTERHARHHEAEVGRWRRMVFFRDRYTCQRCGDSTGHNLRGHHVKPWATNPDSRFDVDNGQTLCKTCHAWVHSAGNTSGEHLA